MNEPARAAALLQELAAALLRRQKPPAL